MERWSVSGRAIESDRSMLRLDKICVSAGEFDWLRGARESRLIAMNVYSRDSVLIDTWQSCMVRWILWRIVSFIGVHVSLPYCSIQSGN